MISVSDLNARLGIDQQLSFSAGSGGLIIASINAPSGNAQIALQGAHLIDFCPQGGKSLFWQSPRSHFLPGKAIRGGIPICWPWFGPHPQDSTLPAHGLARTALWQVIKSRQTDDGIEISLALPALDSRFPDLRLQATFSISNTLHIRLETRNLSKQSCQISQALHSYFRVSDCQHVSIDGLDGCEYIDKTQNGQRYRQQGSPKITGEVDRIYLTRNGQSSLVDPGMQRSISIEASNSGSTVIWNPGPSKAAAMADVGADCYRQMLCIESANATPDSFQLAPGDSHQLSVRYASQTLPVD